MAVTVAPDSDPAPRVRGSERRSTQRAQPRLSVVATSRNDEHGGNLALRMQWFLDGLAFQADRVRTPVELVLVEWNPPQDRGPLVETLRWPPRESWLSCRVITVPPAVHDRIMPQKGFGMMQMIAKNVGIRMAEAPWVLATNIDILFPDDVFDLMLSNLDHRNLFRVDRVDVPFPFPDGACTMEELLRWCADNPLRVASQNGSWVTGIGRVAPVAQSVPDLLGIMGRRAWHRYRGQLAPPKDEGAHQLWEAMERFRREQRKPTLAGRTWERLVGFGRVAVLPKLHTNACGDFTLLSQEAWRELRGYPEWPIHSLHIDSVFVFQARAAGLDVCPIGGCNAVFHMEHSPASGWTPEGGAAHMDRIKDLGVEVISPSEMRALEWRLFFKRGRVVRFNGPQWGCADDELHEVRPVDDSNHRA